MSISFILPDGGRSDVTGENGLSIMELAVAAGVDGIDADCGGACSCATCHVYVDDDWLPRIGPATADEIAMLEFVPDLRAGSRLSCQIAFAPELDGLTVRIPDTQR
jgi:ferredoxin, 2Fe-2S